MNNAIVLNTGPLIALGRIEGLDLLKQLPFAFKTTEQVCDEIRAGSELGYPVVVPFWVDVLEVVAQPSRLALANLDPGEVSVIEAALYFKIPLVCIDELKGRRAAAASGLRVIGSLGLLGRAKTAGIVERLRPLIEKAQKSGTYYDRGLVDRFLREHGE